MNNSILPSVWRFLILVAVQGLVLERATEMIHPYFNILLYPLFILLLPIQMPTTAVVLLGALIGFAVDTFYTSYGEHASAGAFSGWARAYLLAKYIPKGGSSGKDPIASPVYFGWPWFLSLAAIFFGLHLLWYFSVNAFTFVYVGTIALKAVSSLALTMIFVALSCVLFEPKN